MESKMNILIQALLGERGTQSGKISLLWMGEELFFLKVTEKSPEQT